ncbi:hypothetical protein YC2023_034005 [Brassica napus]
MQRRGITRTPKTMMRITELKDTDLLRLCSISLHLTPALNTRAFLQLTTFSLRSSSFSFWPPEFLNNHIEADEEATARDAEHAKRLTRKKKKAKPKGTPPVPFTSPSLTVSAGFIGVVVEAKPQLVGIHERVRNDIDAPPPSSENGEKRISTATNPNAEEAADLLRMCLQCGVPKTYTSARGMVCPVCGDRPLPDSDAKKRGSAIKDKEKSKRMRGQSSHASWKSETEMQLRQHFD